MHHWNTAQGHTTNNYTRAMLILRRIYPVSWMSTYTIINISGAESNWQPSRRLCRIVATDEVIIKTNTDENIIFGYNENKPARSDFSVLF